MYIYTVVLDLTQEHGNYQTLTFFCEKSKFPYNTKFSRKPHLGENIYLVGILAAVQSFSMFLYNT